MRSVFLEFPNKKQRGLDQLCSEIVVRANHPTSLGLPVYLLVLGSKQPVGGPKTGRPNLPVAQAQAPFAAFLGVQQLLPVAARQALTRHQIHQVHVGLHQPRAKGPWNAQGVYERTSEAGSLSTECATFGEFGGGQIEKHSNNKVCTRNKGSQVFWNITQVGILALGV